MNRVVTSQIINDSKSKVVGYFIIFLGLISPAIIYLLLSNLPEFNYLHCYYTPLIINLIGWWFVLGIDKDPERFKGTIFLSALYSIIPMIGVFIVQLYLAK